MDRNLKALADLYAKKYGRDNLSMDQLINMYESGDLDHQQDGVLLVQELDQTIRKQKEVMGLTMEELSAGLNSRLVEESQG